MAIPKGTEIPKASGQFAKLVDGKNKFRVLSDVVVGWEGWKDQKPFRHEGQECEITADQVDLNKNGHPNINYFWAMIVWNYEEQRVQILELTQKTIMRALTNLEEDPEWGDLKNYDIAITRMKDGDKVSYAVTGQPPKELAPEVITAFEESDVDLQAWLRNE